MGFNTRNLLPSEACITGLVQDNGLVPVVEPEILLDGEHGIDRTFEVAGMVWAEVFFYLAENNVRFKGILLMVTPGAEYKDRASLEIVAEYKDCRRIQEYTLRLLPTRIPPPAVPDIKSLLGMMGLLWKIWFIVLELRNTSLLNQYKHMYGG